MSHACCSQFGDVEPRRAIAVAAIAGKGLSFAAAPVFAVMALATWAFSPSGMLCMSGQGASALGGMATMYLLMAFAHLAPWLGLIEHRRSRAQR